MIIMYAPNNYLSTVLLYRLFNQLFNKKGIVLCFDNKYRRWDEYKISCLQFQLR